MLLWQYEIEDEIPKPGTEIKFDFGNDEELKKDLKIIHIHNIAERLYNDMPDDGESEYTESLRFTSNRCTEEYSMRAIMDSIEEYKNNR